MTVLSHPNNLVPRRAPAGDDATLAVRVAAEQVAYWRGCGLRIADMWDAIEYRHHGGERELLVVLAERWVDCRRWLAGAAAGINADVAA